MMKSLDIKGFLPRSRTPKILAAIIFAIITVSVILVAVWSTKKGQAATQKTAPAAIPVKTAKVVLETVPLQVSAIGTVQPYSTVAVKSEANGALMKVAFTEGQYVEKGDLLFVIDP